MRASLILVSLVAVLLAGCKADVVQVRLTATDVTDAVSGKVVDLPFEAKYKSFGSLDAKQRAQLDHIREIAKRYIDIEEFQISATASGVSVEIEGSIPLIYHANSSGGEDYAYAVVIEATDDPNLAKFPLHVRVATGARYGMMEDEMQGVSYMSAAEKVNPLQFRLRANGGGDMQILAGGFEVDGERFAIRSLTIPSGESLAISFSGGIYDDISGSFLMAQP